MITDTKTGKRYVGKADGQYGLWQRWSEYIRNGHGGDIKLIDLLERDEKYAEKYFWFTILEPISGEKESIINKREDYWKDVFKSRYFGYNKN